MTLKSMTGFGHSSGTVELPNDGALTWRWAVRSVNGKNLEIRQRLPVGFESIEARGKRLVQAVCTRGNVSITLSIDHSSTQSSMRVNRDVLSQYIEIARSLVEEGDAVVSPACDFLNLRGVMEIQDTIELDESADNAVVKAILDGLEEALNKLVSSRASEGAILSNILEGHLKSLATLTASALSRNEARTDGRRVRLKEQVSELFEAGVQLPEERLTQELAILALKSDVAEELDRLKAHLKTVRNLIQSLEPIGRKFDFLCQELNREANTLCSKSSDLALTNIGLDLKTIIDRVREQVQNIE